MISFLISVKMSVSEIINQINQKLDLINNQLHLNNANNRNPSFSNIRYSVELKNLSINAFARLLKDLSDKKDPKNVFAVFFDCQKTNDKKISKISIVSNEKQDKIIERANMIINLLNDEELEGEINKEMIQSYFDKLIENARLIENVRKTSMTKLELNIDKRLTQSDLLDQDYKNQEKNFKLYVLIQDLILVLLLKSIYDFSGTSIEYIHCKDSNHFLHCESLLALKIAGDDPFNRYIGVSKLCCPLCQKLLKIYGFIFRGSHDRFVPSIYNWRFRSSGLNNININEGNLSDFHQWLEQLFNFITELKNDDNIFSDFLNLLKDQSDVCRIDQMTMYDEDDFHFLRDTITIDDHINRELFESFEAKYKLCI